MLTYDSNLFYYAVQDCRRIPNRDRCETIKSLSLRALEEGKVRGCFITPTVAKEVRRIWIKELAPFCKEEKLTAKQKEFVKMFVDKLTVRAMKDPKFFDLCTSMAKDKFKRLAKSMKGDWRLVAEAFLEDDSVALVSFDHNIWHSYCVKVYKETAEEVAKKLNVKIANVSFTRPDQLSAKD